MTTQQMLDERYGRGRGPSTQWVVGSFATVGAVVAILYGWMTFTSALDDVTASVVSFDLVDDRTVTVDFQVTAPTGRPFSCILEARDVDQAVVGWKVVEYAASDELETAYSETIPTIGAATTGLVNSCWVT